MQYKPSLGRYPDTLRINPLEAGSKDLPFLWTCSDHFHRFVLMKHSLVLLLLIFTGLFVRGQQRDAMFHPSLASRQVKYYPNPATSFLNIEFSPSLQKQTRLQVFNFLGNQVMDIPANTERVRMDLADLKRGIYIYQLKDRSGKVIESGKFQIEK